MLTYEPAPDVQELQNDPGFGLQAGRVEFRREGGQWREAAVQEWTPWAVRADAGDDLDAQPGTYTVRLTTGGLLPESCEESVEINGTVPPIDWMELTTLEPASVSPGAEVTAKNPRREWDATGDRPFLESLSDPALRVEVEDVRDGGTDVLGRYSLRFRLRDDVAPNNYNVGFGTHSHRVPLAVLPARVFPPGMAALACDVEVLLHGYRANHQSKDNQGLAGIGEGDETRLRVFILHTSLDEPGGVPYEIKRPDRGTDTINLTTGKAAGSAALPDAKAFGFEWPWKVFEGSLRSLRDFLVVVPVVWERDASGDADDHPDIVTPDWDRFRAVAAGDARDALQRLRAASLPTLPTSAPTPFEIIFNGLPSGLVDVLRPVSEASGLAYAFDQHDERHRPVGEIAVPGQGKRRAMLPQPIILTAETALALAQVADATDPEKKGFFQIRYRDEVEEPKGDYTLFLQVRAVPKAAQDAAPPPPAENLVDELICHLRTGGDDLRGGDDNLNLRIDLQGLPPVARNNVNDGERWADHSDHRVTIALPEPVPLDSIGQITLQTTFGGGMGGDNWNLDALVIEARGEGPARKIYERRGDPLQRFTGDHRTLTVTPTVR